MNKFKIVFGLLLVGTLVAMATGDAQRIMKLTMPQDANVAAEIGMNELERAELRLSSAAQALKEMQVEHKTARCSVAHHRYNNWAYGQYEKLTACDAAVADVFTMDTLGVCYPDLKCNFSKK